MRRRVWTGVSFTLIVLLSGCGSGTTSLLPSQISTATVLRAILTAADLQNLIDREYWDGRVGAVTVAQDTDPLVGELFFLVQVQRNPDNWQARVNHSITLLDSAEHAADAVLLTIPGVLTDPSLPAVGDRTVWSRTVDGELQRLRVGFSRGPFLVGLSIYDPNEQSIDLLVTLANELVRRLDLILSGNLTASPLAAEDTAVLPPASVDAILGTPLMDFVGPPEALISTSLTGDVRPILPQIVDTLGVTRVVFRAYSPSLRLRIVPSPEPAASDVLILGDTDDAEILNLGTVIPQPALFLHYLPTVALPTDGYGLAFANRGDVVQLSAFGPGAVTPLELRDDLLAAGEAWTLARPNSARQRTSPQADTPAPPVSDDGRDGRI